MTVHVALDRNIEPRDLREKGRERGRAGVLVGQSQIEEFVERVAGLRPEPRQKRAAAAARPEQARVEGEGRQVPAHPPQQVEQGAGGLVSVLRRAPQRVVQRAGAAAARGGSDRRRRSRNGRLQRRGEREVVFRRQRRAADGGEIHHRDMLGELQPVGACRRHVLLAQGADHRLEKGVAAAHENHDVAGADRAAPPFSVTVSPEPGRSHRRMVFGDAPRAATGGSASSRKSSGSRQSRRASLSPGAITSQISTRDGASRFQA